MWQQVRYAYCWSGSLSVRNMTSTHRPINTHVKQNSKITIWGIQHMRRHLKSTKIKISHWGELKRFLKARYWQKNAVVKGWSQRADVRRKKKSCHVRSLLQILKTFFGNLGNIHNIVGNSETHVNNNSLSRYHMTTDRYFYVCMSNVVVLLLISISLVRPAIMWIVMRRCLYGRATVSQLLIRRRGSSHNVGIFEIPTR